ncbi:MAG: helix-turn-helix transcriptional regulator [Lachnospiraceae bacterium]|nr:helix-turn-helix transcriptional regulator [Lachnospiraceae bacterium]
MSSEFEVVSHEQFSYLNVFLVRLFSRTPHIHRDLEIGVILEGSVSVKLGTGSWKLGEGDIYLINSLEVHEFAAEGDGTLVLAVQVSLNLLEPFLPNAAMMRFLADPPLRAALKPPEYDTIFQSSLELAYQYYQKPDNYELNCFRLIVSILGGLRAGLPTQSMREQDYAAIKRRADRLVAVTDYIDRNFQRKLLLDEIAQQQHLTMTYLSHLFKEAFGLSFQEYLKEKRFEYAYQQLSRTGKTVLDVSLESGFSDVRYLNRLFREKLGCSPQEYRARLSGTAGLQRKASLESLQHFLTEDDTLAVLTELQNHVPGNASSR